MRLIHRERSKHREHLQSEISGKLRTDGCGEFRRLAQPHPAALQGRKNFIAERPALPFQQPLQLPARSSELFRGAVARRIRAILIHLDQLPQSGDAHHEELIELAAENGDEFQPNQQRIGCSKRLDQHPGVEIDPAQLPADEELLIRSLFSVFFHFFLFHVNNGASSIFNSRPNT